jgi:hypothetical protein
MHITAFGVIVIPISFVILLLKPNYLVCWAVLVSAFQAASVLNVGGGFPIGITPYFFVASLIAARFLVLYASGRLSFEPQETVVTYLRPLWLLTLWAVCSAFLLPILFAGVAVYMPRNGMEGDALPLHWTLSNAAQAGYMTLNAVFVVYAIWLSSSSEYVASFFRAFCWSGILAAAVGVYQLLSHLTGLPYPSEFFNSNPAWAQLTNQTLGDTWRMSATFTEPSAAGAFFAMWSAYMLCLTTYSSRVGRSYWPLLWIGLTMLILTTSTTGYFAVAAVLALFMWKQVTRLLAHGTINPRLLLAFVSIGAAVIVSIAIIPDFMGLLANVFGKTTDSDSSQTRFGTAWLSLQLVRDTWGMGAGLGSNRPSGMLFYIFSNLGIPGIALFCYLVYVTYALVFRMRYSSTQSLRVRPYIIASAWAFGVELLAMIASGAELSASHLWISWALVLAASRQAAALHADPVTSDIDREDFGWREAVA